MIPSIPDPIKYDITPDRGFLSSTIPLDILSDPYYAPWENIARNLQPLILSKRLRGVVNSLSILRTDLLRSQAEWQRAYSILSFIVHGYIWGGDEAAERVPPPLSAPFLSTCEHFELPPVATYAAVVLWNFRPLFDNEPIDSLSNLATHTTFTGSLDESWFYLVSVAIEARAAPIIPMMLDAVAAAREGGDAGSAVVTECLRSFAERLDELGALLQRMYESCDPHVFYHRIRPFLAGSKNMADAGLPRGVIFDYGTGDSGYVQLAGGSNAQSSVIQFFDIILGVEHRPTHTKPPARPSTEVPSKLSSITGRFSSTASPDDMIQNPVRRRESSHNFILDMRNYMPGSHRRFLEQVARVANIHDFVNSRLQDRPLVVAYDACLAMLRAFRDKHMQMVSRYIIIKSREARPGSDRPSHVSQKQGQDQSSPHQQAAHSRAQSNGVGANIFGARGPGRRTGTGGTALIPFLKQARDETGEPAIDAWARRLLNNGPATYRPSAIARSVTDSVGVGNGAPTARATSGGAMLTKLGEHASGEREVVGLAGTWSVDDSEGGICHW